MGGAVIPFARVESARPVTDRFERSIAWFILHQDASNLIVACVSVDCVRSAKVWQF